MLKTAFMIEAISVTGDNIILGRTEDTGKHARANSANFPTSENSEDFPIDRGRECFRQSCEPGPLQNGFLNGAGRLRFARLPGAPLFVCKPELLYLLPWSPPPRFEPPA